MLCEIGVTYKPDSDFPTRIIYIFLTKCDYEILRYLLMHEPVTQSADLFFSITPHKEEV